MSKEPLYPHVTPSQRFKMPETVRQTTLKAVKEALDNADYDNILVSDAGHTIPELKQMVTQFRDQHVALKKKVADLIKQEKLAE
jgi:adenosyl cobinamide kinase/adenosyl cobinamide phosphate guanylyltransferase